jgi:hypothetical protein
MVFGQSSEKMGAVLGGPENPESAPNVEDFRCPESKESPVRELQGQFADEDAPGPEQNDNTVEPNEPKQDNGNTSKPTENVISLKPRHKGHGRRIPKDLPTMEEFQPELKKLKQENKINLVGKS